MKAPGRILHTFVSYNSRVEYLVVLDDNALVLNTVRLVLEQAGYDVLLAHDGQEAVALLAQSDNADRINTVLCDLDMPNMKGGGLMPPFAHPIPKYSDCGPERCG